MKLRAFCTFIATAGIALAAPRDARAAEPFVERPNTLPRLTFAANAGLGVAHYGAGPLDQTGAGLNLEGALGITDRLEVGLRTGLRLGDGGRATGADAFGRTLNTETYGTRGDVLANPELRVRGNLVRIGLFELALEGRMFLPVETGSRFGGLFGVPLAVHVGNLARIDTGVFVPVIFTDPAGTVVSVPVYVWFQPTERLFLGPMAAARFVNAGTTTSREDLLLGFGLGYSAARFLDLKTMLLFPRINGTEGARNIGIGFGVELRIGDGA